MDFVLPIGSVTQAALSLRDDPGEGDHMGNDHGAYNTTQRPELSEWPDLDAMEESSMLSFPVEPTELESTLEEVNEREASVHFRQGPAETDGWHNVPNLLAEETREPWGNSVHFAHCVLDKGDTLVFVDVPTSHKDSRCLVSCDGVVPASQMFRVHSEKLLALTESEFPQMLDNEIYQARVKRRRKLEPDVMEGIKYLLDLTPPREGDDLVFQMTELSLTPGIINWWNANLIHKIPTALTRGHDDICACRQRRAVDNDQQRKKHTSETEEQDSANLVPSQPATGSQGNHVLIMPPEPADLDKARHAGQTHLGKTPLEFQIPDYCPFRHCNSIVRLMLMVEGKTVNLNSAARVWTMVGISKIFECSSVVRDQVAQWVMLNAQFVEVLPEEAIRIGYSLRLPQLTQASFRILVNELALDEAGKQSPRSQVTIFGRRRGDVGDEASNAIQHAAQAFSDRIAGGNARLQNADILDLWNTPQWQRLRSIEKLLVNENDGSFEDALASLGRLIDALSYQVPHKVRLALGQQAPSRHMYHDIDRDRATYVAPQDWARMADIMRCLTDDQKLLLPFFYSELSGSISSYWYFGRNTVLQDYFIQSFDAMTHDTERALQKLIDAVPSRAYEPSWQFLFGANKYRALPVPSAEGGTRQVRSPLVDMLELDRQVKRSLWPVIRTWLRDQDDFVPPLNLTRHMLLTLTRNEMKFLPLWAGGDDDGTGGVFDPFLPPAEMGPNGPGPAYHTGLTVPSAPSSISDSFMEEIRGMKVRGSTTAGSVAVNDSISTVYRPDQVIAAAADSSIMSESFEDNNSEYDRAKYEIPADHQGAGQSLTMILDTSTDYDAFSGDDYNDDASDFTETAHASDGDSDYAQEMPEKTTRRSSTSTSDAESMVIV